MAAAAVVAFLLLRPSGDVMSPDQLLRGGSQGVDAEGVSQVIALSPVEGDLVPADSVAFVWRSVEPEALYRFTVTDRNGDELWSSSIADTMATLTLTEGLRRGGEYFWYVDALLSEGRSATTGIQRFRTEP